MEASGFRDAYPEFQKRGVAVVGVSADPPEAQQKFKQKYNLPFPLLCDVEKKVVQDYGVLKEKNNYGKVSMGIERTTVVIDPSGKVRKVFPKVKVEGHVDEVLAAVKE